ncbi:16S rRNA (cytosine(1402)-N(4))-methyltransferase RsmH [Helicobacter turcicus]|uniref:Ribosomal RNA small subunit methyltransferase H n=1 Tax=Helicobacter turcicus TaxID=2867412 RepID=A0ABS7JLB2_9HELI|nr:16S rRNA (cytosine(1402)-N(4))-methyltransferase RsmH [Helicobacter turcicus]MBX7490183.1 16S rRNA (cytosine(1402)-N(4))-methyltransferase RsmH [Helicobacter turcicus]MBX7545238.1 16S rRNA (cytosine(1402)-N(4))-methyltransferase RsmH [Helicobacter turcicus]
MEIPHIPVLLEQVLDSFDTPRIAKGGILLDCTLGFGGHTFALLERYPSLEIIGIDQDKDALDFSTKRLRAFGARFSHRMGRYSAVVGEVLSDKEFASNIVGILADIGVSSMQFDDKERGFCFDSPILDMRMDKSRQNSAKEIVNSYNLGELEHIFRDFGEIREYKKLARLIIEKRKVEKFTSAKALSTLIAKHFKHPKIHPATQAFQALRIAVNDELGELERLLATLSKNPLSKGARVSIITFHSLEDRIVKQEFRKWERDCICDVNVMRCICGGGYKKGQNLYKKPLIANKSELKSNPRSRSAKLRSFEFGR